MFGMKRFIGLAAAVLSGHAFAIGSIADVEIIDRATGRALPIYKQDEQSWVAGTPGAKYAIRLRNSRFHRVLAVMSVDGVNVLTGDTAASGQAGYVYEAFESGQIAGWRKSDSEIAAFEFVASPQSYAERTGRPDHVGVIGIALFRERAVEGRFRWQSESLITPEMPAPRSLAPLAAPMRSGALQEQSKAAVAEIKLGTGHGERETSHVTRVEFVRESNTPNETIHIRYDSRENLLARGVIKEKFAWRNPFPNPFPSERYVPDPPTVR